jgi:hypothetical protein
VSDWANAGSLSDEERLAWLRLIRSEGVGPQTFRGSSSVSAAPLPRLPDCRACIARPVARSMYARIRRPKTMRSPMWRRRFVFLAIKIATKFVGILPLTWAFHFDKRGAYTTLLMSTGLTFGAISALFGFTNHLIDQQQNTILVTSVIGSAVVPTLIAQRWFQPEFKPIEAEPTIAPQATWE